MIALTHESHPRLCGIHWKVGIDAAHVLAVYVVAVARLMFPDVDRGWA